MIDDNCKKLRDRRKNRLEFESGCGTKAEALIIIKMHWRNYEAARNEVKLGSFAILILLVIVFLICETDCDCEQDCD